MTLSIIIYLYEILYPQFLINILRIVKHDKISTLVQFYCIPAALPLLLTKLISAYSALLLDYDTAST